MTAGDRLIHVAHDGSYDVATIAKLTPQRVYVSTAQPWRYAGGDAQGYSVARDHQRETAEEGKFTRAGWFTDIKQASKQAHHNCLLTRAELQRKLAEVQDRLDHLPIFEARS